MVDRIEEVNDLKTRGRLESLQGVVHEFDANKQSLENSMGRRKGHVEAGEILSRQLMDRMNIVQAKIDSEEVSPETGKLLISEIQSCVDHVRQFKASAENEIILIRGRALGLENAAIIAKQRFDSEVSGYERKQKMEAEMEEERAERKKRPAKKSAAKKSASKKK